MKNPIIDGRLVSDMTFAIRFRDFIMDVDVNDAISEEEKEYLLMVAEELIDWQLHTSSQASDEEKQYLDNVKDIIENKKKCDAISNGHEYVDLGLPSGTLWSTCNVGAKKPENAGLYFAWGSLVGYEAYEVGKGEDQKQFSWLDYGNRDYRTNKKLVLKLTDDAAYYHMGGNWRMPTKEDFDELLSACTWTWTTINSVNGWKVQKGDKYIFFPAAGYCDNGSVNSVGNGGRYWSSSLLESDVVRAWDLYFNSSNKGTDYGLRFYGRCVRGVIKPTKK